MRIKSLGVVVAAAAVGIGALLAIQNISDGSDASGVLSGESGDLFGPSVSVTQSQETDPGEDSTLSEETSDETSELSSTEVSEDISDETSASSGDESSETLSSEDPSTEDPSSETGSEESGVYRVANVASEDLPQARQGLPLRALNGNDPRALKEFCAEYNGVLPAIADVHFTKDACYLCVVYEIRTVSGSAGPLVRVDWLPVDAYGRFGDGVDTPPDAFDKDTSSSFVLEGNVGQYMLYHQNGAEKTLIWLYTEDGIRVQTVCKTDHYAVLSFKIDGEYIYTVMDTSGKELLRLDLDEELFNPCVPLTFCGEALYCKVDTDGDFVYDAVGKISLPDGTFTDAVFVGNGTQWNFSKDGSGITVCGVENSGGGFYYLDTATDQLRLISVEQSRPTSVEPIGGTVYGQTANGNIFLWDARTDRMLYTECSSQAEVRFADSRFAVFTDRSLILYTLI